MSDLPSYLSARLETARNGQPEGLNIFMKRALNLPVDALRQNIDEPGGYFGDEPLNSKCSLRVFSMAVDLTEFYLKRTQLAWCSKTRRRTDIKYNIIFANNKQV